MNFAVSLLTTPCHDFSLAESMDKTDKLTLTQQSYKNTCKYSTVYVCPNEDVHVVVRYWATYCIQSLIPTTTLYQSDLFPGPPVGPVPNLDLISPLLLPLSPRREKGLPL